MHWNIRSHSVYFIWWKTLKVWKSQELSFLSIISDLMANLTFYSENNHFRSVNYVIPSMQCVSGICMLPRMISIHFFMNLGNPRWRSDPSPHTVYHPSFSSSPLHTEGIWVNLFYSKIISSFRKSTYSQ